MEKERKFCTNCGEEIDIRAEICPKCGVRTRKGVEAGVSTPWKELKDSLSKIGQEIEKAFSIAGKEMEKAAKKAREEIREATSQKLIVCSNCREKNFTDAHFCYKCGKKLD